MTDCILCSPTVDEDLGRIRVWQDDLWRLSTVTTGQVAGRSTLEPHRHIPSVAELDGAEAEALGPALARAAAALRDAAAADRTYVYAFGDRIQHLHFVLLPHRADDALLGGAGIFRPGAPEADPGEHARVARDAQALLGGA